MLARIACPELHPDETLSKTLSEKMHPSALWRLPEIPPDVTQVRIMSLHKSKGLSSPVVVIAGCIEGLLPAAPDDDKTPAEQQAELEEQRHFTSV